MKWNWSNIPLPEVHLAGIAGGILLQRFYPKVMTLNLWVKLYLGWPIVFIGITIAIWAVLASGKMKIASPTKILNSGPYAYSRNPMYTGWTILLFGIALVTGNFWIFILLIPVITFTHFFVILREEKFLMETFGKDYGKYKSEVRRYF